MIHETFAVAQQGASGQFWMSPQPTLVIFDLDDTLADYAKARASRLRRAFMPFVKGGSAAGTEDILSEMIEASIALSAHGVEHFPGLFIEFGIEDRAAPVEAARWYREHRYFDLALFPEAIDVLVAVRGAPHGPAGERRLGIVTNGPAAVQRDKINLLGINRYVDFVIVSGEVGLEKPDPRIFELALTMARESAANALFVGDAPEYDIGGARGAGLRSVWVNRHRQPWPYADWHPSFVVDDLAALVPLLTRRRTGGSRSGRATS